MNEGKQKLQAMRRMLNKKRTNSPSNHKKNIISPNIIIQNDASQKLIIPDDNGQNDQIINKNQINEENDQLLNNKDQKILYFNTLKNSEISMKKAIAQIEIQQSIKQIIRQEGQIEDEQDNEEKNQKMFVKGNGLKKENNQSLEQKINKIAIIKKDISMVAQTQEKGVLENEKNMQKSKSVQSSNQNENKDKDKQLIQILDKNKDEQDQIKKKDSKQKKDWSMDNLYENKETNNRDQYRIVEQLDRRNNQNQLNKDENENNNYVIENKEIENNQIDSKQNQLQKVNRNNQQEKNNIEVSIKPINDNHHHGLQLVNSQCLQQGHSIDLIKPNSIDLKFHSIDIKPNNSHSISLHNNNNSLHHNFNQYNSVNLQSGSKVINKPSIKVVLKQFDMIKSSIHNLNAAYRGVQYLRQQIKKDIILKKRIKQRLQQFNNDNQFDIVRKIVKQIQSHQNIQNQLQQKYNPNKSNQINISQFNQHNNQHQIKGKQIIHHSDKPISKQLINY